jgi:energy-coupling factor transporter ATP-binding protein EcfA2
LFFGRDRESEEVVERLRSLRRRGGSLLLLLGASGCGKSSLARAGVVPQLRQDPVSWLVLEPFRPGKRPFLRLNSVLKKAFSKVNQPCPQIAVTAEEFVDQTEELRYHGEHQGATIFVTIDQLEELLVDGGVFAGERDAGKVDHFLTFLGDLLGHGDGLVKVMATLRSDFLGVFQLRASDLSRLADQVLLGPMREESYIQVIAEPARRVGLHLEPGLSKRMAAETGSGDALPLLAYTLWDLWDKGRVPLRGVKPEARMP